MKEIVFGAGGQGRKYCEEYGDRAEIIAFADNNEHIWGRSHCGYPIIDPKQIRNYVYDRVVVAIDDLTDEGCVRVESILTQLEDLNISSEKIMITDCRYSPRDARVDFLRKFSSIVNEKKIPGVVAECGVYRGHFSGYINRCFPDRMLYLRDTFKGFDECDVLRETNASSVEWCRGGSIPWLLRGNANVALLRCEYRDKVNIVSGFVPDSLNGLEDERFVFVNLDMDLYAPTLAALRFFFSRMTPGGIILTHDYYHTIFSGIKDAVDEFSKEASFTQIPIDDDCSIAICPHSVK